MNTNGTIFRVIAIGGAVVCLLLLIWAAFERHAVSVTDSLAADVRKQISTVQEHLNHPSDASLLKQVSAPASRYEEAAFLTFFRDSAAAAHIQVTRLQSVEGGGDMMALLAKTPEDKALLEGLKPVAANIELQGAYTSLLQFTNRMLSAPRLYNLNNLAWNRGKSPDETHLQLFIVRYVGPEDGTPTPAAPGAAGQVPKA